MKRVYGYCRISRKEQNIERQVRNITAAYPEALIRKEAYTGTRMEGRKQFEKIVKEVQAGDVIVFDSVSRMSRNAEEGVKTYFELYNRGVNLVFLKERHIDTESYKKALEAATGRYEMANAGTAEGDLVNAILEAINRFMQQKAADDIYKAFDQAEKEVTDLHERTREGIETARRNGKQIGRPTGSVTLKADGTESKSYVSAQAIKKAISEAWSKYPDMKDKDVMKLVGVSRGTYYKYKKEITAE